MQIAVSERPNVRCALTDRWIRPKAVAENVAFPQYRYYFVILYDLEAAGYDEAQRVDGFSCVI